MCTPLSDLLLDAREEIIAGNLDTARSYLSEVNRIKDGRPLEGSLERLYNSLWGELIEAHRTKERLLATASTTV